MGSTIFWVSPHMDDWRVRLADCERDEGSFDARDDAIAWACRVASHRQPSIVRVADYAGNVTAQFSFDSDTESEDAPAYSRIER